MSAPTKGSGMTWVGRSIRRLEDPALVAGRGNFTADLPAANWVRFVRSPMASGRIERIDLPPGANVITAADVAAIKPIRPMLHKFNYVPVAQPIMAADVVRFVGEVIAAVVAPSKEEAEDIADRVEVKIAPLTPVTDARRALAAGAPIVHPEAPANVIVEGRIKTPNFDATQAVGAYADKIRGALAPAKRHAAGGSGRARGLRRRDGPRHADLHNADAASDADRDRRRARHA